MRLAGDSTTQGFPWDFAINWTAARGQLAGVSLYDWVGLQRLGLAEIGEPMTDMYHDPTHSAGGGGLGIG